ncbi:MAG: non-canonical purine NTP pyrophosphatase, partial [Treponema sp.]|nr:non-canonical purine NTP pyrophosphatase [Treponema sp.]
MTVWFATGSSHKKGELAAILNPATAAGGGGLSGGIKVLMPKDSGLDFDPEETGTSFHENALLKAAALHSLLESRRPPLYRKGDPVIADDSGLCVDALGGRPGIYSARYTGAPNCGAASAKKLEAHERNALLLEELDGKPLRTARFVCAMVLYFGPDRFFLVQETAEGEIVKDRFGAKGTGGFGYDPVFFIPEFDRTMAEISD